MVNYGVGNRVNQLYVQL